ncbi:MAG: inositol monophosphatase family protein [Acidimicrobiales bacterium]|nr:inositol monophosphatase family protein [Acidimicrobiales bacterium]
MSDVPAVDPALVDHAVEIARAAGELTLEWFRRADLAVDIKGDGSPITAADLAAETFIRGELAAAYPGDAVIGEEHADAEGTSGRTWVIDPIDGTKAFTKGVPLYANLLALVDEHGPAIGVINLPALGETLWAGRGHGAVFDGEPCRVSDHRTLAGAYVCTSEFGYWPPDDLRAVLAQPVQFRTWGDAYGYSLVATGRAEAMIDPRANPWDVAPVAVIIAEAGGRFTGYDGNDAADAWRRGSGVATNGVLHDELLAVWGS